CCSVFIAKCLRKALRLMNHSTDGFTHRHTHYIAYRVQIENDNRQLVVAAHGDRSCVHHAKRPRQHFLIGDLGISYGVGELERVFVVDAVDAGGFSNHVGLDFQSAQGGGGIGGKVGIGGARRENHDTPLFQVTDGAAPDVRLGHLVHFDGAHHARRNAHLFEGVAEGQRIDDRGQHAHVVAGDAVHAAGSGGHTTKDVAAAH